MSICLMVDFIWDSAFLDYIHVVSKKIGVFLYDSIILILIFFFFYLLEDVPSSLFLLFVE